MMSSPPPRPLSHAPLQSPRPSIVVTHTSWNGCQKYDSVMEQPHKNKTAICRSGREVVGNQDARDVRLQLYISLTLGVGAFLLFCVRRSSLRLAIMR